MTYFVLLSPFFRFNFAFRTKSAKSVASERTEKYLEMSTGYPSPRKEAQLADDVNVMSIEPDFDREARELYEWSQFL